MEQSEFNESPAGREGWEEQVTEVPPVWIVEKLAVPRFATLRNPLEKLNRGTMSLTVIFSAEEPDPAVFEAETV